MKRYAFGRIAFPYYVNDFVCATKSELKIPAVKMNSSTQIAELIALEKEIFSSAGLVSVRATYVYVGLGEESDDLVKKL